MRHDDSRQSPDPPDDPEHRDAPATPVACGTHRSGHDPHHMQHRFCCQETRPDDVSRLVSVIEVSDRGWITFEMDGAVVRRWNHHAERVRAAIAASDGSLVEVSLRWKLLTAYRPDLSGAWVFSLSGGPSPCGRTP
ncbi:MAG: hypothetical protein ACOYML_04785 [Microthrixaceae bacterium]|jgi:hypothetical protein